MTETKVEKTKKMKKTKIRKKTKERKWKIFMVPYDVDPFVAAAQKGGEAMITSSLFVQFSFFLMDLARSP